MNAACVRHTLAKVGHIVINSSCIVSRDRRIRALLVFTRRGCGRVIVAVQRLAPDLYQTVKRTLALLAVNIGRARVLFGALLAGATIKIKRRIQRSNRGTALM